MCYFVTCSNKYASYFTLSSDTVAHTFNDTYRQTDRQTVTHTHTHTHTVCYAVHTFITIIAIIIIMAM